MARGWQVLDATSFAGRVSGKHGRITFSPDGHAPRESRPAEELAVVLIGPKTSITAAGLHYLAKHDIALLAADWRGVPRAGLFPWGEHTRVGARHIAQSKSSEPRRKNGWMRIVRAKVIGQAATLRATDGTAAQRLEQIAAGVRSGDPGNAEGVAARVYWSRLFGRGAGFGRDVDGKDARNAMLNYGYMILRGHGIRATLSAGLSPALGVFHRGRSNYFNLVDDMIEPFRPAIDAVVATLDPSRGPGHGDIKQALVEAASQPFTANGHRIPAVLDDLAQQFGRYVEGDVDRMVVPAWGGPVAQTRSDDGEA